MSERERAEWLRTARQLQAKVSAAHEKALKKASDEERQAQAALQDKRVALQRAMRAAHDAGMSEITIAKAAGRSNTAVHFAITRTVPVGNDPATRRRAEAIKRRLKTDGKSKK